MANNKLLICAALATGLLVTACVKKEEPKNEEQPEQATETQMTEQQPEAAKTEVFESLESINTEEAPAPVIETTLEETENTTTEIRRETRPAQTQSTNNTAAQSEAPRTEQPSAPRVEQPKPSKSNTSGQSEEDAVAAAIAAATPALSN
ncbi:hypothetical protein [Acinetobacter sp. NIPH 298]|uniref:hypothetical protein n=1 Tax=Acinetobacter sp. NIPH 298 TaxID=1217692 RepID=UPI0002D07B6A|nr:hypothetical protein [Acinetobacter sp. NIPH 298]ENW96312.1 hypothetical protein F903_02082 [Acinetobacter sp. NIPH 298]